MKKSTRGFIASAANSVQVFPTVLHIRDGFLPPDRVNALAAQAVDKADVEDAALAGDIASFALSSLAGEGVDIEHYEEIEVTEMWFNVLEPGEHHWDHTHANHVLSGIIYLADGCFTIFSDPRPAASVLSLNYRASSLGKIRNHIHKGQTGSAVLFPSWLPHRVATTDVQRKTISFNLILRGQYGAPNSKERVTL